MSTTLAFFDIPVGASSVPDADTSLRDAYARYFLTVLDASMHEDESGRRLAQVRLEEVLGAIGVVRGGFSTQFAEADFERRDLALPSGLEALTATR